MITAVFAVYAFTLLAALLVFGSVSDHVGRRPALALGLIANAAAMLLFINADGVMSLVAARALQGGATGIGLATLGAALIDDDPERGPLANSVSPLFGMAAGSLGSGLLIDIAPHPLTLGYSLVTALMLAELVLIWLVPETAPRRPGLLRALRPVVAVPPKARRALALVIPYNIAGWALAGLYLSLGPSIIKQATGYTSLLIGGGVVASLNISGASAILATRHWSERRMLQASAVCVFGGMMLFLAGLVFASVLLLWVATLVTGLGFGPGFLATIRTIAPLAEPHERGGLMAAFLTASYLSFSVPSLAAGFAVSRYSLIPVALGYTVLVAALSACGAALILHKRIMNPLAPVRAPAE